jgi:hypothetical protein
MIMRLRANVNGATGKTKHAVGEFVAGKVVPVKTLPVPAWVEISEENGSFYLLYFDTNGNFLTDTWHQTVDEAKRQAEFEFGISAEEWTSVPCESGVGASG